VPELLAASWLLGASTVLANRVLPSWAYSVVNGSTALLLLRLARSAGLERAALGLDPRHVRRAGAVGLAGAATVALGFGVALAVPSLRQAFDDRRIEAAAARDILRIALVRIPVGTVLLEEVAFRSVLPALLGGDDRWRRGPVLGASAMFGLWHVLPSMELHRNAAVRVMFGNAGGVVVPVVSVLAAGAAGVVLSWYRHTGRGLLAPVLLHGAANSGGAILSWWVRTH
jgi:CAAX protease family protein